VKFFIRDRDMKFTADFDEVFRSKDARIIRTPIRALRPNAFAERFVGTVRRECLDRLLIFNQRHLETVLFESVAHYNAHRTHRSIDQRAPLEQNLERTLNMNPDGNRIRLRDRIGELIDQYEFAA
jgi:putative transposase